MVAEIDEIGGALEFLRGGEGFSGKLRVKEVGVGVKSSKGRGGGH